MTTDQDIWSSPCSYLCCFMRKPSEEEVAETLSGDSPEGLINDGDNLNKYGAINHDDEDDVSWDDLAIRHDSDEGIDITDDLSHDITDSHSDDHLILTNPLLSDKLTSDEDVASVAQTRILVKDTIQTEVVEGQENLAYVPSPVQGAEEEEEEEEDARISQEEAKETLDVREDTLNYTGTNEDEDKEKEKEEFHKKDMRDDNHDDITPEPLLILPSSTPPKITVTKNSIKIQNSVVPSPVPMETEESLKAIGSCNDITGSNDSLSKQKKKSKFKKFKLFKRKKKKNDKLSDEYKSSPSLSPAGQSNKIKSGYSMNSIISNLDPDERNIASD